MPSPQRSVVLWWVLRRGPREIPAPIGVHSLATWALAPPPADPANLCPFFVQPATLLVQLATLLDLPTMLGLKCQGGPGRAERHPEEQHQQLTQHL